MLSSIFKKLEERLKKRRKVLKRRRTESRDPKFKD